MGDGAAQSCPEDLVQNARHSEDIVNDDEFRTK
jgi:hypothetical protein